MKIGNRDFDTEHRTCIMGILNVTPDSFSDGGRYDQLDRALRHTDEMLLEGADIIDIGGESTRPGHTGITDEEEISRVAPVIEAVKNRFDVPISIDTYKSSVAQAALEAGACLVNDIWGFKHDPAMAPDTTRPAVLCTTVTKLSIRIFKKSFCPIWKNVYRSPEMPAFPMTGSFWTPGSDLAKPTK